MKYVICLCNFLFFFPAQLFLTEVLPASDDVDLAVGELTWSYRLLSDSAPIFKPTRFKGAAQKCLS